MRLAPGSSSRGRDRHHESGFVIVAVLWILAALAALVSVYSVYVIDTAFGSRLGETRLAAEASIKAGVELAAYRLIPGAEKAPPTSGTFTASIGNAQVEVAFLSEGARVDLNQAAKPLLAGLIGVLGTDTEAAANYAERIVAWRSKPKPGDNREVEFYQRAGSPSLPRQEAFQNVAELRLVLGLPSQLVEQMLPYVTVFNGRAEIDPMIADPTVLLALPNMSSLAVEEILEVRKDGEPRRVLELLGPARASVSADPRRAARVNVHVGLDSGRRVAAEVVILLMDGGPDPYRVLAWRDDFDRPDG